MFKKNESTTEDFYALRDVSFNVSKGESIGIIGKNGAGKSTLLKILSKITPPSSGKIISRGRIASLLEVGTGFHAELSGRENIFLNGSILGMKKFEIQKNFDAIVDFSGVEKFLDTPLKHYSSGMQLRLAFAVAAFLENEILIIDEVLAVGDSEFQKKCMKKMSDVSNSGRTILFVSHNMSAVTSLCTKCIYLSNSKIRSIGETNQIVNQYLSQENNSNTTIAWEEGKKPGDDIAILHSARLIDESLNTIDFTELHKKTGIELTYEVLRDGFMPIPNIHVFTAMQEHAFFSSENNDEKLSKKGIHKTIMWIPENLLNDTIYSITLSLTSMKPFLKVHSYVPDALFLNAIEDINKRGNDYNQKIPGILRPKLTWETI
ncbi:MAG: ABC transporter ATP-binding protein [Bacteroidota bacterium]